jgi:hypothetical protein
MPTGKNIRDFNQVGYLALAFQVYSIFKIKCTALKRFKASNVPAAKKYLRTLRSATLVISENHLELFKYLDSCTILGI